LAFDSGDYRMSRFTEKSIVEDEFQQWTFVFERVVSLDLKFCTVSVDFVLLL